MDLFLAHCLGLLWLSLGASWRLAARLTDQLLAAALLAWGNLVVTGLLLASVHRLGATHWYFATSLLLASLTCLLLRRASPETPTPDSLAESAATKPNRWLLGAFVLTLCLVGLATAAMAWTYRPDHAASFAWQLPRALYFLGQDSLAHFDAADLRQTHLPFNSSLLQLFGLTYGPALQCLNLFNLLAWAAGGMAVHRLCRLHSGGANAALVASWLVLLAPPVLAQANSTSLELPAGVALLCALVFAGQWWQTRRRRHALLAGLAAGLAAGSDLRVALLGLAVGLLGLGWSYRGGRAAERRAWIVPALLACFLAAPFAAINFAAAGNWFGAYLGFALHQLPADPGQGAWAAFVRLWCNPSPPFALNEDTVGAGFAGALFLLGGALTVIRPSKPTGPAGWCAWLGLAWILLLLCPPWRQNLGPRDFVPAWLLLAPAVAALVDASVGRLRFAAALLVLGAALASGWSSVFYLLRNTSRPLLPLLNAAIAPPASPSVPLLMEHHLTRQPRVNVDTDGVNELIFPFLALRPHQRVTSRHQPDPESYNLLSRAALSRNGACIELARRPAYSVVPIPSKRTAGVEFLATVGSGSAARDYFGLLPHAGLTQPINSNRCLLVTLYREPAATAGTPNTRVRVAGLNPEDQARLVVTQEHGDGRRVQLAGFDRDGEAVILIDQPFHQLGLRVFDAAGAEIGATALPYEPQPAETATPVDPLLPTGPGSIFVTDLVLARDSRGVAVTGLLPVEGPFPQWDLPSIRWQREPSCQVTIPAQDQLARLQLSFSVRLHVRKKAALDVLLNGRPVQRYRIDDPSLWLDQKLELTLQPGPNVLEFKDAPLNNEPDWLGYLELYPDVKTHVADSRVPAEQGARDHYEKIGRAEGRTLPVIAKPERAPDGYYFMYRSIRVEGFKTP